MPMIAAAQITIADLTDGMGIDHIVQHYGLSDSGDIPPISWIDGTSTAVLGVAVLGEMSIGSGFPEPTQALRYLWFYETIYYTDGSQTDTAKRVIGIYGEDGLSIETIETQYYLSTSKEEPAWEQQESPLTFVSGDFTNGDFAEDATRAYVLLENVMPGSYLTFDDESIAVQFFYVTSPDDLTVLYTSSVIDSGTAEFEEDDSTTVIVVARDASDDTADISDQIETINEDTKLYLYPTEEGGEWTDTMPDWRVGLYIWTRNVITMSDESVQITTPYCDTSWEAAKDVQTNLDAAQKAIQENAAVLESRISNAEIQLESDRIISTVLESSQYSDGLQTAIGSAVQQTKDEWNVTFSNIQTQTNNTAAKVSEIDSNVNTWFNFNSDATLSIGKSDSRFSVRLGTESLDFMDGVNVMSYFQNNTLYNSNAEIARKLKLGNFVITVAEGGDALIWS